MSELPGGKLYSALVIYNNRKLLQDDTDDTKLSLDVTKYVIKSLKEWNCGETYYYARDSEPGANIFKELTQIIKDSERIIVILTKGFLDNFWADYCQQSAFKKLLDKNESEKLVPIAIGIRKSDLPANLTVTEVLCFEEETWMGHEGWSKLKRVMKKETIGLQETETPEPSDAIRDLRKAINEVQDKDRRVNQCTSINEDMPIPRTVTPISDDPGATNRVSSSSSEHDKLVLSRPGSDRNTDNNNGQKDRIPVSDENIEERYPAPTNNNNDIEEDNRSYSQDPVDNSETDVKVLTGSHPTASQKGECSAERKTQKASSSVIRGLESSGGHDSAVLQTEPRQNVAELTPTFNPDDDMTPKLNAKGVFTEGDKNGNDGPTTEKKEEQSRFALSRIIPALGTFLSKISMPDMEY